MNLRPHPDLGLLSGSMEVAVADRIDYERAWLPHDRRGRWVVIEPGAGHHMTGSQRDVRRIADLATPRRARRFSSLSRAKAFAHSVHGTVRRWRRTSPSGGTWRRESPWQWTLRGVAASRSIWDAGPGALTPSTTEESSDEAHDRPGA